MRSAFVIGLACLVSATQAVEQEVNFYSGMPLMGPVAPRNLQQSYYQRSSSNPAPSTYRGSSEKTGHDWGWGSFLIGLCLIPFSLALIWQNEKKIVRFHEVIVAAREEIKPDQDPDKVCTENEKALVHMMGTARNDDILVDEALNYSARNCYRIKRTVEMYQRFETAYEEKEGDRTVKKYRYDNKWSTEPIYSGNFQDPRERGQITDHVTWPFQSHTTEANRIMFGVY